MTTSLKLERGAWLKATTVAAALALFFALNAPQALASHVKCGDVITEDTKLDTDLIDCPGDGVVIGADGITLDLNGHTIATAFPGFGSGVANYAGHHAVAVEGGVIERFEVAVFLRGAKGNRLRELSLASNDNGIRLRASAGNRIERNSVSGGAFGMVLSDSDSNRIEKNSVFGSRSAMELSGSDSNRIEKNSVTGNLVFGIALVDSDSNRIGKNSASGNGRDGIFVDGGSGALIERNVASRNGDDGIDVDTPATTLTRNRTNENGNLGIEAVPGVNDGGGNRASGNGNRAQCLNIDCK
jgi:parallel beta-helix repeat protein